MALCVGLGFVSNLPLFNCFGVGKAIVQFLARESEQAAVQAGLLRLLWNLGWLSQPTDCHCELGSWVDVHMPGTPVMQFLINLSVWVKQKVEIPPRFYLFRFRN